LLQPPFPRVGRIITQEAYLLQELCRTDYSIGMQHDQQGEGIVCF